MSKKFRQVNLLAIEIDRNCCHLKICRHSKATLGFRLHIKCKSDFCFQYSEEYRLQIREYALWAYSLPLKCFDFEKSVSICWRMSGAN